MGGILLGLPLGLGGSCSFFIKAWLAYLILTKKIAAKILLISSLLSYFSLCLGIYLSGRVKSRSSCSSEMSGFNSLHLKFMCGNELFGVLQTVQDATDYFDV